MPHKRKFSDDQVLESYSKTGNIWKSAEELGVCGQSVWERLKRLREISRSYTDHQQQRIFCTYSSGIVRGDGKLDALAEELGIHKTNICRFARRNGLTNPKRQCTKELVRRQAALTSERFKKNGHPRGMKGLKHTQETKDKISRATTAYLSTVSEADEDARIMKMMKTRAKNGTMAPNSNGRSWKAAWRTIGGVKKYYRSSWEANYARYLQFLKENKEIQSWLHEPETFWFEGIKRGCMSYLPDFKVTRNDGSIYYVEVKGWMDKRSKTKLKRMAKYHPEVELELVDSKAYRKLAKTASMVINGWEKPNSA